MYISSIEHNLIHTIRTKTYRIVIIICTSNNIKHCTSPSTARGYTRPRCITQLTDSKTVNRWDVSQPYDIENTACMLLQNNNASRGLVSPAAATTVRWPNINARNCHALNGKMGVPWSRVSALVAFVLARECRPMLMKFSF